MNEQTNSLTLEQQFKLSSLDTQIKALSLKECHKYIYELIRQGMIKDNLYKMLMKGDNKPSNRGS